MSATAYPLTWPDHIPRFRSTRQTGGFKTSLSKALDNVESSLKLFGRDSGKQVSGVVLSSNVTLGKARPQDPGVAVWFTWDELQVCIPVDRYATPEANLQAIHHIIEARRTELRHGTLALVRASFMGFKALPSPNKKTWREIFNIGPGVEVTRTEVDNLYKSLAKKRHPDAGGSADAMAELNAARDQALKELPA